jgi:hypothetical protein
MYSHTDRVLPADQGHVYTLVIRATADTAYRQNLQAYKRKAERP